jgi:hypothetical protein
MRESGKLVLLLFFGLSSYLLSAAPSLSYMHELSERPRPRLHVTRLPDLTD